MESKLPAPAHVVGHTWLQSYPPGPFAMVQNGDRHLAAIRATPPPLFCHRVSTKYGKLNLHAMCGGSRGASLPWAVQTPSTFGPPLERAPWGVRTTERHATVNCTGSSVPSIFRPPIPWPIPVRLGAALLQEAHDRTYPRKTETTPALRGQKSEGFPPEVQGTSAPKISRRCCKGAGRRQNARRHAPADHGLGNS